MKTQIGIAQGGDFSDNTMTFEIEGEMILCAGKYAIVPIDDHEQLVNNVVLDPVSKSLQADIRNKLSAMSVLIDMLEDGADDEWLEKQVIEAKKSIDYLCNVC